MKRNIKTAGAVVLAGALFAAGGMGAATAKDWIDGADLKPGSVTAGKLSNGVLDGIKGDKGERGPKGARGPAGQAGTAGAEGVRGLEGPAGAPGPQGPAGTDGLLNAVYRVAHYNNGGGGRATVACGDTPAVSQQYVAIAGGAQSQAVTGGDTAGQPITSSFPGRMDWNTNTPIPGRLDGWIVNFGNGNAPSAANGTLEVWALCVPNTSITTQVTNW